MRWLTSIGVLGAPDELNQVGGTGPDAGGVIFVPALVGDAASLGEALGPAELETIIEPAITADEAAERMGAFPVRA